MGFKRQLELFIAESNSLYRESFDIKTNVLNRENYHLKCIKVSNLVPEQYRKFIQDTLSNVNNEKDFIDKKIKVQTFLIEEFDKNITTI